MVIQSTQSEFKKKTITRQNYILLLLIGLEMANDRTRNWITYFFTKQKIYFIFQGTEELNWDWRIRHVRTDEKYVLFSTKFRHPFHLWSLLFALTCNLIAHNTNYYKVPEPNLRGRKPRRRVKESNNAQENY